MVRTETQVDMVRTESGHGEEQTRVDRVRKRQEWTR